MKNGKVNFGFSYILKMANFEAFRWVISSSINLLFLKSDILSKKQKAPHLRQRTRQFETPWAFKTNFSSRVSREINFVWKLYYIIFKYLKIKIVSETSYYYQRGEWRQTLLYTTLTMIWIELKFQNHLSFSNDRSLHRNNYDRQNL